MAKNEEQFLQEVMISRSEWCTVCQAQFLTPGLVVKHLVSGMMCLRFVHSDFFMHFQEKTEGQFTCTEK